jgi:short subunit dehydrogenase-like uncharacterized protein
MTSIWVYGATGRGGRAIAQKLAADEAELVLVGRDETRLNELARSLPGGSTTLVAAGASELVALIAERKPAVVVNTVGPFGDTALTVAGACLRAGGHYLDLANELDPVRGLLDLDASARDAGVTLVTGAGFGVLATESLVIELRGDRAPAQRAFAAALPGVDGLGSAVLASSIDVMAVGGRRYRDGRLVRTRFGAEHAEIPLPDGRTRGAVSVPIGELEAAHRASGAGEVVCYSSEVPSGRLVRAFLPAVSALLARRGVRALAHRLVARLRLTMPVTASEQSWAYARLEWADGDRREAWLRTGEGYEFTGAVAAAVARRLAEGTARAGAFTPGALFGAELAREAGAEIVLDGVRP